MGNKCKMTDEEIYEELEFEEERFADMVWDNIRSGAYVVDAGAVFDCNTMEFICNLKVIQ